MRKGALIYKLAIPQIKEGRDYSHICHETYIGVRRRVAADQPSDLFRHTSYRNIVNRAGGDQTHALERRYGGA